MHRKKVGEIGVEERKLVALGAWEKDETGGLVLDQSANHRALFFGELVIADADIAEEDYVILGEVFDFIGKFCKVIGTTADAELWVKEQTGKFDTRVARERVAEEAIFPAWERFDNQDTNFFGFAGNGKFARIVERHQLALRGRKR